MIVVILGKITNNMVSLGRANVCATVALPGPVKIFSCKKINQRRASAVTMVVSVARRGTV